MTANRKYVIVRSGITAQALAQHLIECGVWFDYEPWPDDQHQFTVKAEAARFLVKDGRIEEAD